ncbi:MAG: Rdx family protein [Anaerolineales bacterium]|nr:SelT/SelW/SelH family protein [Chloroflexota bacterium]MBL6980648.1 Rdx family protein [Anaerolineales bacterium]
MASALLTEYKGKIQDVSLVPSDGGKFEVKANEKLVYSKIQTGRHAEHEEVLTSVGKLIG